MRRLQIIGAQILEWMDPDVQAVRRLLQKRNLPVVVAERRDAAVVGPVDEFLARPVRLALERGHQVIAVEVHLVVAAHGSVALEQLLRHVGLARCGQDRRGHILRAPISLITVPGLMTPGQRIKHGTRPY